MYYINAISSISHQPTFNNDGFSKHIEPLGDNSEIIKPIYKEYINPKVLRRMGNLIRMSVASSSECITKIDSEVDAIIVGTGLGCLTDTVKFLTNFIQIEGLIPPTSFIQSTHNTIAGQISLNYKNNGYNTTYTQNTLSFELALEDAMICLDEGMDNVLVGAADEFIPFLDKITEQFDLSHLKLTSAVTFLVLSKTKTADTIAKISDCQMLFNNTTQTDNLSPFLAKNNLKIEDIDTVKYTTPILNGNLNQSFKNSVDISSLIGTYPTNSAFGLHLAVDEIQTGTSKKVLIYNNLNPSKLGLTLIESI
jgi:3-oxoacyl-[acyl-carrier-protein] synthase II